MVDGKQNEDREIPKTDLIDYNHAIKNKITYPKKITFHCNIHRSPLSSLIKYCLIFSKQGKFFLISTGSPNYLDK